MRCLQADDQQQSHNEKAQYLWQMSKNTQKSVDSIRDIRFNAGMDARKMKKIIQYEALGELKAKYVRSESRFSPREFVGNMLDRDIATFAQMRRFEKVLDEMLESALANYPMETEFDFGG